MARATKFFLSIGIAIVLLCCSFAFYLYLPTREILPTYFNYSKTDLNLLRALDSSQEITQKNLMKWDQIMFDLIKENKLGDVYASRIYAYVYTAQRDAVFLSHNVKHTFMGSIEPVSAAVLCLFFTDSCSSIKEQINSINNDKFSNSLSKIVMKNIIIRMQQDKNQSHLYDEPKVNKSHWIGIQPYYGEEVGSWKTWLIKSGHEFIAPPPPASNSVEWHTQVDLVLHALKHITPDQINQVIFWAGNPSTVTPPGIWLIFANDYMNLHEVGLEKTLYVRSVLAMSIADSVITVFNSKYTYWVKRPFMRNPSIHTIMPTPNHPSYPAGHSTLSATAAAILTYFFPQNGNEWKKLASIASKGRVWGGIHFPIDAKQGALLGNEVGDAIIHQLPLLPDE